MFNEIDNEVAELANSLHLVKAYEKDGVLNADELIEDRDFGTFDSLNEVYLAAKNLVKKITALE